MGVGAALERGPPGARGDPTAQISSSARLSNRNQLARSSTGAALGGVGAALSAPSSSHPLVGGMGVGLAPSPSPQQFDSFGGQSQREQSSRSVSVGIGGGGVGMGQFINRGRGNGRPVQPAPMLDLEELMSGQDDPGSRSEWDDVLASISMPHVGADQGMGRSESPGATRG